MFGLFVAWANIIPHIAIRSVNPIAIFFFILNSFGSVCFHFFFSPLSEPLFYFQGHRATHGFASLIPIVNAITIIRTLLHVQLVMCRLLLA